MSNATLCPHCGVAGNGSTWICNACKKILPISSASYFAVFELPQAFEVNLNFLDQKLFEKLKLFHPDQFINSSELEKKLSFENANIINSAYKTLKSPLSRAKYLLELKGMDPEHSDSLDEEFLMETMAWREQLEEKETAEGIKVLLGQITNDEKQIVNSLTELFNQSLYPEALKVYIRLKFIQRFKNEVESKLMQTMEKDF